MSTRYNNGSHYENHHEAAELHELAEHAHRAAAEQHGKQDHETGQEMSRRALEHSRQAFESTQKLQGQRTNQHGITTFCHEDISALAHRLWVERGSPEGSPDEDWFHAAEQLRMAKGKL